MWMWTVVALADTPPVVAEMHERFTAVTAARDAVIRGDLEKAKAEASWLSDLGSGTHLPKPWRPYLASLNEASAMLAGAADLRAAAGGVANAAGACAECHAASGGGPALEHRDDIPSQVWQQGQNMPLHKWAVEWMWLGLLSNNDEAWMRGAKELDKMPLVPKFEEAPPPGGLRELEQLVYVLASKAATTTELTARQEIVADLIATCSQCHSKTRPLPAAAPAPAPVAPTVVP